MRDDDLRSRFRNVCIAFEEVVKCARHAVVGDEDCMTLDLLQQE